VIVEYIDAHKDQFGVTGEDETDREAIETEVALWRALADKLAPAIARTRRPPIAEMAVRQVVRATPESAAEVLVDPSPAVHQPTELAEPVWEDLAGRRGAGSRLQAGRTCTHLRGVRTAGAYR
jgi:hypothetical protein